jgi:ATP synthase protein I
MAGADNKSGREPSGRDPESIRQRLDTLGQQLAEAKARRAPAPQLEPEARGAALGKALRLATELVAGVVVGGFIGWALDRAFGSAPFLMVVFLILGSAAGIMNVVRSAKAMQAEVKPGKAPPAVLDDDDD